MRTIALLSVLVFVPLAQARVDLVRDGKPVAVIQVPEGVADDSELMAAARELRDHVELMSGTALQIVTEAPEGNAVVLGEPAVQQGAAPTETTESLEGFRVLTKGNRVLIGGQSDIAMRHGVYALLESLGCDWVMPGEIGVVVPKTSDVTVADMDVADAPDFLFRRLWYRGYPKATREEGTRWQQWLARQRGGTYRHPANDTAGHVWQTVIARNKELFEQDPTMLALVRLPDGTLGRRGPQLETTHPRVIQLFIDNLKATYRKNIEAGKWTKNTVAGFGIGPADGLGYSLSAESMLAGSGRIDAIVGEVDRTDEMILLANRILEEVRKEYPNALVGYYSYSTHADYPIRYKPHPGVVQIFAPINFSRYHSVLDPISKTQAYYRNVVEQWGALSREQGNPLIYRGYSWNLADNLLPYSKLRIWGEELPYYKEHGFLGLNVEATKGWSITGASDYVFMRLSWDTSRKWQDELRRFCVNAFGDGADAMEQYFLAQTERQRNAGQEAGSYHAAHLIYDRAFVESQRKLLEAATAAARTPEQKTRISYIAHNLDTLSIYLDYHAATLAFDFPAVKRHYDALHAHWQKGYDLNPDIVSNEAPAYLNRFLGLFVEVGLKHATEPYRIVERVPDELPTMFDPNAVGERMAYHTPEINDAGFVRTRTISTTWDAQGLAGLRSGAVWYRHHFTLPADLQGEPIGLFIGGVEDEARVWINGRYLGTTGRAFSKPAVFDLTDGLASTGDNVLAIQVVRNSAANEIGLGGIIRPCYLFTGPRLEQAAPKPAEGGRVLPGQAND